MTGSGAATRALWITRGRFTSTLGERLKHREKARQLGRAFLFVVTRLNRRNHVHDFVGIDIDDANLVADEDVLVTPPIGDDDHDVFGNIEERHITGNGNTDARLDLYIDLGAPEMTS